MPAGPTYGSRRATAPSHSSITMFPITAPERALPEMQGLNGTTLGSQGGFAIGNETEAAERAIDARGP